VKVLNHFFAEISRVRARLIREILVRLGVSLNRIVQLRYSEYPSPQNFRILKIYSLGGSFKFVHPRDSGFQYFSFQERFLISATDLVLDSLTGTLFDSRGRILTESSSWPKTNVLLNSIPKPKFYFTRHEFFEKDSLIFLPSNGFYHWLIEDLPSYLFALDNTESPVTIIYEGAPNYVKDLLPSLPGQVIFSSRYQKLREVSFTTKNESTGFPEPRDLEMLRSYFGRFMQKNILESRIYISRLNSTRSPLFERELCASLIKSGWEVIYTENMNLLEQIEVISKANVLCGVSGAGLANAVWMNPGTKLIELSSEWVVPCFSRLAQILNIEHRIIRYEATATELADILDSIHNEVTETF
jgi:hypothetical protein